MSSVWTHRWIHHPQCGRQGGWPVSRCIVGRMYEGGVYWGSCHNHTGSEIASRVWCDPLHSIPDHHMRGIMWEMPPANALPDDPTCPNVGSKGWCSDAWWAAEAACSMRDHMHDHHGDTHTTHVHQVAVGHVGRWVERGGVANPFGRRDTHLPAPWLARLRAYAH